VNEWDRGKINGMGWDKDRIINIKMWEGVGGSGRSGREQKEWK